MQKRFSHFLEGMISAFAVTPVVPVKPVELTQMQVTSGNAAQHWQTVGLRMSAGSQQIKSELRVTHPHLSASVLS
jgi:hypothetical protein